MKEQRCVVCDGRVFDGEPHAIGVNGSTRNVYLCYQHRKNPHFAQTMTGRWIYHQDYGPVHALGWPDE